MTLRLTIASCCLFVTAGAWGQAAPAPSAAARPAPQGPGREAGVPPPLPNAATETQVRELLQLTDAPTRVHKDLSDGVASMKAKAPPYVPATVWTEMDADFRALDIVQIYLPVYQAYLTQPEMASLLTFYRTDAGKHYATVQGQLLAGTQAVLGQRVQAVLQATAAKHRDEIEAARKKAEEPAAPAPGATPTPAPTPGPPK